MLLESKLKQAALRTAVDVSLKRIKKSPERCARNLIELGVTAYPKSITPKERQDLYQKLLEICKREDNEEAKTLFFNTFH
ncbi:MAG TPA: hypothetical protein VHQ24_06090 [Lachnospiraceae bacterium]|jgi:hypothetical protein|nr:hypothetical protein [Lachnospiraceae bacterium]